MLWTLLSPPETWALRCGILIQADATAPPLASFALIMAAEAVETSATTNFPPEISASLSFFINSPGGRIFRTVSDGNKNKFL